jgi:hypothetical protein
MDRLTIAEAADRLGVTRDAVRKRIKRNSIKWEDGSDGETYVYVDVAETAEDVSDDASGHATSSATDPLVESLQEQVEYLRREVEAWQEEARRKDHLLAAALERIPPALEGPPETRESPVTDSKQEEKGDVPEEKKRPWWRRMFGG